MNPSFFHIEHGRLMSAALDRDASRRHEAPKPRRRPRDSKVRFQLRLARVRAA
jgi:hypothetical protein